MARDDFSQPVRDTVARRVGFHCSNPECRKLTSGPRVDPQRALNIGVAAHITAASPGGPRFDSSLTPKQRRSIENAIWMCRNCGTLVDYDEEQFTVEQLREWKARAERAAAVEIAGGSEFRPIAAGEVRQELTVGELAAVRALSEEFGCHVESNVYVAAEGWLRLHAAVVRGEDLIGIDIHEHHGSGLAYFQIEHLIALVARLKFERFRRFVLYIAVVSDGPPELDEPVKARLKELAGAASFKVYVRMYRLNALRAKYGL